MDEARKAYLLKLARGKDFRRALKAIAELRSCNDRAIPLAGGGDEQREFQAAVARLVLGRGVEGLVAGWSSVGSAPWRAELISEIGQFSDLWPEAGVVDLALAALQDASKEVRIKAVWMTLALLRARRAMTPAQRSRMTRAMVAMLEDPRPVLAQLVEALGQTATRADETAIARLESLRSGSGEPYRVSHERVQRKDYAWYDKLVMQKKGIDPDEIVRIKHEPTGLLDRKLLDASLARIKRRAT